MNMISHDYISPYLQAFEITTVCKAFKYNIPITFSGKHIQPVYNCKGQKIAIALIPYAVAWTHMDKCIGAPGIYSFLYVSKRIRRISLQNTVMLIPKRS